MIVYSKTKLVYKDKEIGVFLYKNKLLFRNFNQTRIVELPANFFLKLFFGIKLIRRLFRIDIRCFERIGNHYYFFFKNTLYVVDDDRYSLDLKAIKEFEMSSPLYFCKDYDGKSILFGDYTNNGKQKNINIYKITNMELSVFFSFKPGIIKHIHNITSSTDNNCYWILTGDSNAESAIWKLDNNKTISPFLGPSQISRSCFSCELGDKLYYLTDSPIIENYIIIVDKKTKQIINKIPIPGPCIFAKSNSEKIFFTTSVEPNPDSKSVFKNYKKSKVIKDWFVHVCVFNLKEEKVKEIQRIKKDWHNMKYFGFGNANIFIGEKCVFVTPAAVKKYSYKTLKIDYE